MDTRLRFQSPPPRFFFDRDRKNGGFFLIGVQICSKLLAEADAGPPISEEPRWLTEPARALSQDVLLQLMALGGFPEPFTSGSAREAARWRAGYGARLVREDVRDLEAIQDLTRLELLFDRLPATVGSPLSINALREDLEVAFATVKKWIDVFERLYASFTVPPFGPPRIKAVKKEAKLYLWDWARVEDEGARFENLVAAHLQRFVHWLQDVEGARAELRYFRSPKGHEVDFVVLVKGKPWFAVEAKLDDRPLDPNLSYLLERAPIPHAYQVTLRGKKDHLAPSINGCRVRVLPAAKFLAMFP